MKQSKRTSRWLKILLISAAVLVVGIATVTYSVRYVYTQNLAAVSGSNEIKIVTIPKGASLNQISKLLKNAGVIRQTWAFEWYVRSKELRDELQAGTYAFRPSMNVEQVVNKLANGEIATDLVTILPGKRLGQLREAFIESGFAAGDVERALLPEQYAGHPALVDKPVNASLEGYLYPDSFQKTSQTKPEDIVRASLDEMHKYLSPGVRAGIAKQGLSVFEGVTLASIVEKEVSNIKDKPIVAQVFLKRLRDGMRLESDATAVYASAILGQENSLQINSPYNTYKNAGLPPGPISNVSDSSLEAVAGPSNTDFLYFVSGDDGNTYFAKTLEEHNQNIDRHCKELCGTID